LISASDFTLSNGLKVIFAVDNSNPIVCVHLYLKVGSVFENTQTSGFAHFAEHLTFKNTRNFPENKISDQITQIGGLINAYTDYDTTCYYLLIPCEHLDTGLKIISDIAFQAEFTEKDVFVEKDIIIEEIKQYANDPESSFIDWIQGTYFVTSPLKHPVLGTLESVKAASQQKLRSFYNTYYRPDNAFLIISGCFEPDLLKHDIELYFSDWTNSVKPAQLKITSNPECNGFRYNHKHHISKNNYLAFILPELNEKDKLSEAMLILTKAFASGQQSRLHKRLVEKDKTALDIRLFSISGLFPGISVIQIVPMSPDVINDIIYAFYDEWLKVKIDFIPNHDIELLKKELIYNWLYEFEYIESLAGSLASEEIIGDYKRLYQYPGIIAQTDSKQFYQALEQYWKADYLSVYYQGSSQSVTRMKSNIVKLFKLHAQQSVIADKDISVKEFNPAPYLLRKKQPANLSSPEISDVLLDNGMRLLMRKVLNKPTIGMAVTSPVSQLCENTSNHGINYFTSNLLLFGTKEKSYDDIQKECLHKGFSLKVNHTLETTTLRGKCLSFSFESMLSLASEILQKPSFPQKFLTYIKANAYDNLRREKSSPFSNAYQNWITQFLGKETNLNKPFHSITQIRQINLKQVIDWYNSYYSMQNFTLCITGDFDFTQAKDLCNRLFSKKHSLALPIIQKEYFSLAEQKIKIRKINSDQSNIVLGGFGSPASDYESNTAFFVLSQILGGELSSRFFNILREKHGYTYQTGFDFTSVHDLGYWFAYAICDKDDYLKVYQLILEIFDDIRTNSVTETEMLLARNYLKGMHRIDMESLSWQATSLSYLYSLGYDYDYFMNREKRIDKITRDMIQEIVRKWFKPENIYAYLEK